MKMKKTKKIFKPASWQLEPERLTAQRVQLWREGIMLTLISLQDAQDMVRQGRAYIISSTAIGILEQEEEEND
jgi:hypothetical protein